MGNPTNQSGLTAANVIAPNKDPACFEEGVGLFTSRNGGTVVP